MFLVKYEVRGEAPEAGSWILKEDGEPLEFETLGAADSCVLKLSEELAKGEGGWIGLLLEEAVPIGDVVEVWVVQEVDLEVTRVRVKGR